MRVIDGEERSPAIPKGSFCCVGCIGQNMPQELGSPLSLQDQTDEGTAAGALTS
jgi:hypothetical protein